MTPRLSWLSLALVLATSCTHELAVFERGALPEDDAGSPADASADAALDADTGDGGSLPNLPQGRAITAFEHSCAIVDGHLYCWGDNGKLQLGVGDHENRSEPTPVAEQSSFLQVCAGDSHTCALRSDGIVLCWGDNFNGELGVGDNDPRDRPTPIGHTRFAKLACWANVSCAIGLEGALFCWGENFEGQLGQNDATGSPNRSSPIAVARDLRFREVVVGQGHVCAITPGGELYCWGRNTEHQLGTLPTSARFESPPASMRHASIARSPQAWPTRAPSIGPDSCIAGEPKMQDIRLGPRDRCARGDAHPSGYRRQLQPSARELVSHLRAASQRDSLLLGSQHRRPARSRRHENRNKPARVGSAADWRGVTTGRFHSCGVARRSVLLGRKRDESAGPGPSRTPRRADSVALPTR